MGYMPVESLRALSDSFAQQQNANSNSYNAIMRAREDERRYLMDRLAQERFYGHEGNKERQRLENGFGLIGVIKNLFGANNVNANTGSSISGSPVAQEFNEQPQSVSTIDKLLERVKGHNKADIAQSEIMNDKSLTEEQKAFMIADKENRALKNGEYLTAKKFDDKYHDKDVYKPMNVDEIIQRGSEHYLNGKRIVVPEIREKEELSKVDEQDNMRYSESLKNQVKDEAALLSDQKAIDKENKKIDKANEKIQLKNMEEAKRIKAQQIAQVSTKKDEPINVLTAAGVNLPENGEWKGDFSQQSEHATQVFGALVDHYASKGDYKNAEKYQREYDANMTAIYKKFGEKWDRKNSSLYSIPKTGGGFGTGKSKLYTLTSTSADKDEFGNRVQDTRDMEIPVDVAQNLMTPAGRKWLKDHGVEDKFLRGDIRILSDKSKMEAGKQIGEERVYADILAGLKDNNPEYVSKYAVDNKGNLISKKDDSIVAYYNPETKKLQQKLATLEEE